MAVKLTLQVPVLPGRASIATLSSAGHVVATGHAVVMPRPELTGADAGAPKTGPARLIHPLVGRYLLEGRRRLRYPESVEYGWHLLLFEPDEAQAPGAPTDPRRALLLYAGPDGEDGRMRRTQGGVRIGQPMMSLLTERFRHEIVVELSFQTLGRPAWRFWKRVPETPDLSSAPVALPACALDETALTTAMREDVARQRRYTGYGPTASGSQDVAGDGGRQNTGIRDRDTSTHGEPAQDSYDGKGAGSGDAWSGGAGHSDGGGASGAWDDGGGSSGSADDRRD